MVKEVKRERSGGWRSSEWRSVEENEMMSAGLYRSYMLSSRMVSRIFIRLSRPNT